MAVRADLGARPLVARSRSDTIRKVVRQVSADHYYAVLTRADDWYVQVGYGERAGTRPGWYALERRDGVPDQHFRTEVIDIGEVVEAFIAFSRDDSTMVRR